MLMLDLTQPQTSTSCASTAHGFVMPRIVGFTKSASLCADLNHKLEVVVGRKQRDTHLYTVRAGVIERVEAFADLVTTLAPEDSRMWLEAQSIAQAMAEFKRVKATCFYLPLGYPWEAADLLAAALAWHGLKVYCSYVDSEGFDPGEWRGDDTTIRSLRLMQPNNKCS